MLERPSGGPSPGYFKWDLHLMLQQRIDGVPACHLAAIYIEQAQEFTLLRKTPPPAGVRCLSAHFDKSLEDLAWAIRDGVHGLVEGKAAAQGLTIADVWL